MEEDEAALDTDRGESAGLLACDASRDKGSTGDAALAGGVADGVGGRWARTVEVACEAEAAGLVAVLADSGRTVVEAVRTADEGVVDEVAAAAFLAGDVSLLGEVRDDVEGVVAVMAVDGLRRAVVVVVVGEASLDAAGLLVVVEAEAADGLLELAAMEWSAVAAV